MAEIGLVVNTAVLIFLVGLLIAYGKWVAGKIMDIEKTLAEWKGPMASVVKCEGRLTVLERELAVHKVSPHCGEEEKKE